jgi:hypothetical protein
MTELIGFMCAIPVIPNSTVCAHNNQGVYEENDGHGPCEIMHDKHVKERRHAQDYERTEKRTPVPPIPENIYS